MSGSTRAFFDEHGYVGPIRAIDAQRALQLASAVAAELRAPPEPSILKRLLPGRRNGTPTSKPEILTTRNRHLDMPAIAELCAERSITDPLHEILGDDLQLWRTQIFEMSGAAGLDWHTDEYRTLLDPIDRQLSVQVPLTAASRENCVLLIPGSHRLTDEEIHARHGLAYREGSREDPVYGTSKYREKRGAPRMVAMVMEPGEFFVFHPRTIHRSSIAPAGVVGRKRLAITLRVADATTRVSEAAFAQTRPRSDRSIPLAMAVT